MASLIVSKPDGSQVTAVLEGEVVVGREPPATLVLKDAGVSRKHARFWMEGGECHVEDLGSANGTFLDGERIEGQVQIPAGSTVTIAEFEIIVQDEKTMMRPAPVRPKAPKAAPTSGGALARTPAPKPAAGRAPAATPAPAPSARAPKAALPPPGGAKPAGKSGPHLKGTSGPWAGKLYPLDKPVVGVGRVAPNDIVVDDDSVSRAHAELAKQGEGYIVRDLGSANGTLVNGAPTTTKALKPGDVIRFGVIEFTYHGPVGKADAPVGPEARRKKLLMIGGVMITLLVVGGIAKKVLVQPPPPPKAAATGPTTEEAKDKVRQEELTRAKIRLRGYLDNAEWDKAIVAADAVIELEPIDLDARKAKAKAEKEVEVKAIFDEARRKKDLGQDEEALDKYFQVPKDSDYFKRARIDVQVIAKAVANTKLKGDCYGYYTANNYERAYDTCGRFLDYTCHYEKVIDEKALKYRRFVETRIKKKDGPAVKEWVCPPELNVWFGAEVDPARQKLDAEISKLYGEPAIAEIMVIYASEGKPKLSYDMLKRLRAQEKYNKWFTLVDQIAEKMQIIDGKWSDGNTSMLQDKVVEADKEWRIAMEKDKEIMPPGIDSLLVKNIRKALGAGWYKEGKKYEQRNQMRLAAECFKKGYEADRANLDLANSMRRLEERADEALSGQPSCSELKDILAMTAEGGNSNKRAKELIEEKGCKL